MLTARLPGFLQPQATQETDRFGADHDGGYIVDLATVRSSDLLLAFGISDDWSFEADFLAHRPVPLHAFDGTVDLSKHRKKMLKSMILINNPKLFLRRLKIYQGFKRFFTGSNHFHRTMVAAGTNRNTMSLGEIFAAYVPADCRCVFIKADIEGSEYRLLPEILALADRISGLVIEFHDCDINLDRILAFVKASPFVVTHVHPNNSSGVAANGIPFLLEISFGRRDVLTGGPAHIPHSADMPNNPRQEDIALTFTPLDRPDRTSED